MAKKRNWAKIKAEYCTTSISVRKLAKKYNIPYSTMNQRALKEKWNSQKQDTVRDIDAEVDAKTLQNAKEKEIAKKIKANELHTELLDEGMEVIKMLLSQYKKALVEGKKKTGATAINVDALMSAVLKCQKGQRLALAIRDDEAPTDEEEKVKFVVEGICLEDV